MLLYKTFELSRIILWFAHIFELLQIVKSKILKFSL